ncbi:AAA family ATPase (plasmid) [Escherichia coli]|uniref:AAA family ATPase n=1 Tax=Escherichia coli TaxID=562 RepID=A0A2I8SVH7_ECOLX|nr:IS21-like element helper ATPase IstB [Escherichia coli]AUV34691.1 AAA family ATPase [Escherichia coli]AUY06012.1 AAA family ATPase [Escherichia coli]
MLNNLTHSKLHDLGLNGMARALELQLEQPQMNQLMFEERLGLLLDAEISSRDTRRIERLLKAARLRQGAACLEDVDYKPARQLDRATVMTLADCNWIPRRQNLILTGATGTGKSWLACAFGKQACRNGYSVGYTTATQLFEDLLSAQVEGVLPKLRRQLIRTQLLIIDDLGIGGIDINLGPILLEIIDQQSAQGSLIITSQFPSDKWYDLFNDPTIADAILDRIVHRSHFITLKGDSIRKLKAKEM